MLHSMTDINDPDAISAARAQFGAASDGEAEAFLCQERVTWAGRQGAELDAIELSELVDGDVWNPSWGRV
jgi:hypothetical protein